MSDAIKCAKEVGERTRLIVENTAAITTTRAVVAPGRAGRLRLHACAAANVAGLNTDLQVLIQVQIGATFVTIAVLAPNAPSRTLTVEEFGVGLLGEIHGLSVGGNWADLHVSSTVERE